MIMLTITCAVPLILGLFTRILYLILIDRGRIPNERKIIKTLIVLGSGGHTTEMLRIVRHLDISKYTPRVYIHAQTDEMSPVKLGDIEEHREDWKVLPLIRSRQVGQSYFTSIATTLIAFFHALRLLLSENPDLILCNGPGTGVPVCLGSLFLKIFFFNRTRIIFVESFCRVKTLSLSGKILFFVADHLIVQWPELCSNNSKFVHLVK
ncbi:UDP-N-acetylglucosamine transferase subunit ALG14 homolog [Diachasmimorpha longicaudata]|uniref:UDP-N-acetylglucosamine transferase subunit ALG14 homolog n=1 Tax=Diachasmimorpha longicaudata TaxID=58733 RepID=UPI0030B8AFEA